MTPRQLDVEVVRRRLAEIDRLLRWLGELGTPDRSRLEAEWQTRLLVERILTQLVEMAAGINLHVAGALGVTAGDGYRDSFTAMADAGVITRELARALSPSAGMRNVLVHDYLDVDHALVAAAVPLAAEGFGRYRHEVAAWLGQQEG